MDVHNGTVSRADDVLVVQDGKLCLKLFHSFNWLDWTRENKAGADVFVLDATEADPNVVPALCRLELVLQLVVNCADLDLGMIGHEEEGLALAESTRLDLAYGDGAHVLVFLRDGDHKWCVNFSINHGERVKEFEKGWAAGEEMVNVQTMKEEG